MGTFRVNSDINTVEDTKDEASDKVIIKLAKERFKLGIDQDSENRTNFKNDIDFLSGIGVWDADVKRERELNGQPCLVIDRLNGHVRQVTNDMRQNPIACKISPATDGSDIHTATVFEGLVRHIQYLSNAETVYENGFYYAVAGGAGYWRVVTEYVPGTFKQEIYIKPIYNSLNVVKDNSARSSDGSDWKWCFISYEMPIEEFKEKYPKEKMLGWSNDAQGWVTKDTIRLCEYFYIEEDSETIYLLADKSVVTKKDYDEKKLTIEIVDEREDNKKKVKWCLIGGDSDTLLDKRDWPGTMIPVVPVYGEQIEVDGKQHTISLIRRAKDPAKMLSYFKSTETHLYALAPLAPFIAAEGQLEGYEDEWGNANSSSQSVLVYKPTTIEGQLVGAPQRQGFPSPATGLMAAAAGADQDIMKATGISESGLGFKSNETSGKAILARQREGDTSTYHLVDNCARSVKQTARILLDIIPNVYDVEMTLRILDESGEAFQVQSAGKDGQANIAQGIYQLGAGSYDVVVSSGASYNTRRQESAAMLMDLASRDPNLMQVAGDIIIGTLDIPGGEKLVERLKAANPLASGDQELPPQVQQKMQEQDQMLQQMQQRLQQAEQELQSKGAENQLAEQKNQIDSEKVRVERFKAETERERMQKEMDIHAAKEDVNSSDKLNHAADLAIKLKQMEIDHAGESKLFDKEKEKEMMSHKASCDMRVKSAEARGEVLGSDEFDSEIPKNATQEALDRVTEALVVMSESAARPKEVLDRVAEALMVMSESAARPKEAIAVRDNKGVLIGVKTI